MARLLLFEPEAAFVPDLFARAVEMLQRRLPQVSLFELQDRLVDGQALARPGMDLDDRAVALGA